MNVEITRDGLTLRGLFNKPDKKEFDLVIIMHGFTGRKDEKLISDIANNFDEKGLATLRFDFNGHGESDGKFEDMTVLNEIGDAKAILDYARTITGVRHIYLLGHSQGGVVASILAGYYPDIIDKLILMSPAATLKDDAKKGNLQGNKYDPEHIPDTVHFSDDKTVGGFYLRTNKSLPIYEIAKLYTGPVCLIHGTEDKIVNEIASERYSDTYANSELHLVLNADHTYTVGDTEQKAIKIAADFLG